MLKVLFVCMGNICRSPAAEGILKKIIKDSHLEDKIEVDSTGTFNYYAGEPPDKRMKKHASKRGYNLDSVARQFNPKKDLEEFEYIVTMDEDNYEFVVHSDINKIYKNKIFRMTDFSSDNNIKEVPDPYYSGALGFENVLNILEDCTRNFLNKILADIERLDQK